MQFDKITSRLNKLCYGLDTTYVDPVQVTMKVRISGSANGSGGFGHVLNFFLSGSAGHCRRLPGCHDRRTGQLGCRDGCFSGMFGPRYHCASSPRTDNSCTPDLPLCSYRPRGIPTMRFSLPVSPSLTCTRRRRRPFRTSSRTCTSTRTPRPTRMPP